MCGFGAALLSAAASPVFSQVVRIEPDLTPGSTCFIELRESCLRTVEDNDAKRKSESHALIEQVIVVMQRVEALPEGGRRVHLSFDRLALTIDRKDELLWYDTDAQCNGTRMLEDVFKPMLGMPMVMDVDAECRPLSFRGMDEIFARVAQEAPDNPFLKHLRQSLTNESCRALWGDARLVLYPRRDVQIGDTWKTNFLQPFPSMGMARYDFNCKLEGVEQENGRRVALVGYSARIRPDEPAPAPPPPAPPPLGATPPPPPPANPRHEQMIRGLRGELEGQGRFDLERNVLVSDGAQMTLRMNILLPGGDEKTPQRFDVEQTCDVTTRVLTEAEREAQRKENREHGERQAKLLRDRLANRQPKP